eukprot:m.121124 g.121124  ORF g.121124 m.121124 type:complete len:113 (-) comp28844_c0_seq18:2024-2362(-)
MTRAISGVLAMADSSNKGTSTTKVSFRRDGAILGRFRDAIRRGTTGRLAAVGGPFSGGTGAFLTGGRARTAGDRGLGDGAGMVTACVEIYAAISSELVVDSAVDSAVMSISF